MYTSTMVPIRVSSDSSPAARRCVQAVDPGAFHVLEHQHAAPGERGHHLGHHDPRLGREVAPQDLGVACLLPEIQLARDPLGELASRWS